MCLTISWLEPVTSLSPRNSQAYKPCVKQQIGIFTSSVLTEPGLSASKHCSPCQSCNWHISSRLLRPFHLPHNTVLLSLCLMYQQTTGDRKCQHFLSGRDESGDLLGIPEKNGCFSDSFFFFLSPADDNLVVPCLLLIFWEKHFVLSLLQHHHLTQKAAPKGICPEILQISYISLVILCE